MRCVESTKSNGHPNIYNINKQVLATANAKCVLVTKT